jgi:hypothetical protein
MTTLIVIGIIAVVIVIITLIIVLVQKKNNQDELERLRDIAIKADPSLASIVTPKAMRDNPYLAAMIKQAIKRVDK